jgi:hypothetical protein
MILVSGSCAASPARIVSSVEMAATLPSCRSTRQSVQDGTATAAVPPPDAEKYEVAEMIGVLIHPSDEVSAVSDLGHVRARRHDGRAHGAKARRRVALARLRGRTDMSGHLRMPRLELRMRGSERRSRYERQRHDGNRNAEELAVTLPGGGHRYSASRREMPQTQLAAISTDSRRTPASRPARSLWPASAAIRNSA